ncbi:MAG: hypothetical protein H6679_05335, partial [Epsilonproteobacteria bacterium]|nr:hypothetical protein [Campylobacterota bacterium]
KCEEIQDNSEAIIKKCEEIKHNSDAIISIKECCEINSQNIVHNSNAIVNLIMNNSILIIQNSNAIVSLKECCETNSQNIVNNSNAIINLVDCCIDNSNAIIDLEECCRQNSNAIVTGDCGCILTEAPLVADVLMVCNCNVGPIEQIEVQADLTINGQGAWIMFSDPDTPQFIVDPGVTLTLENVNLFRINRATFQLGEGSVVVIGNNVTFELSEDVSFAGDQFFVLGDTANPNVFTIRGSGSQKRLIFLPVFVDTINGPAVVQNFDLGVNTLQLQNIELIGIESIAIDAVPLVGGGVFVGAIGLSGNTVIDLLEDNGANFVTEGDNNILRLLEDGLSLNGVALFSEFFDSDLHIQFDLLAVLAANPQVTFADDFIFVGSTDTKSSLIFDDNSVSVTNLGSNSITVDENSFLGGRNIEILDFPIKQSSTNFILDSTVALSSNLPDPIDSSFVRSPSRGYGWLGNRPRPLTALDVRRSREYANLQKRAATVNRDLSNYKPARKETDRAGRVVQNLEMVAQARQEAQVVSATKDVEVETASKTTRQMTREFELPAIVELKVEDSIVQYQGAPGSILVRRGTLTEFGVSPVIPLSLFMDDRAVLEMNDAPTTLKEGDTIFVQGDNNRIVIKSDFFIEGSFNFNEEADLTFEFDRQAIDPQIIFKTVNGQGVALDKDNFLSLPKNVKIKFEGVGTVWFQDGYSIEFRGNKPDLQTQPLCIPIETDPRNLLSEEERERPLLVFREGTAVRLSGLADSTAVDTSTVEMHGVGKVAVENGAHIFVEGDQQLKFCRAIDDDIRVSIDHNGVLDIDALRQDTDTASPQAFVSFVDGIYGLNIEQEGIIRLGRNGVFEFHSDRGKRKRGLLVDLRVVYQGQILMDDETSTIRFGFNSLSPKMAINWPFPADLVGGIISGDGFVELVETGFSGQLQSVKFEEIFDEIKTQELVRELINQVPSLSFSTFFINRDGDKKLLNKETSLYKPPLPTIINLLDDDIITGDDPANGSVSGTNGGISFVILSNGTRA